MTYKCTFCENKEYETESGLWKHNQNKHNKQIEKQKKEEKEKEKHYLCSYCDKQFKHYQTRWTHAQKCKKINQIPLSKQVQILKDEISTLKLNKDNKDNKKKATNITNINFIIVESKSESESEEIENVEITIKNKKYILENDNVYTIKDNKKDKLYGKYINGKVKKIKEIKEIDVK
jgi:hypothetical protein